MFTGKSIFTALDEAVCMYIVVQTKWHTSTASVTGEGKRGPSSHLEPASQPATQPALEPASQSFLKGLWFDRIPWGGDWGIRISSCFPSNTGEDML